MSEDFKGLPFARRIGDEDVLTGVGLGDSAAAGAGDDDLLTGEPRGLPVLGNGTDRCSPCPCRVGGIVSCKELPALIFSGGTPRLCTSSSSSESGDESSSSSCEMRKTAWPVRWRLGREPRELKAPPTGVVAAEEGAEGVLWCGCGCG